MPVYLIVIILGALIGSFLNVCIYRMPRDLSIVFPSSRCPSCGNPDNVPVLSYILLRGRCRQCKARISARYPLVETINAVLYALVLWRYGPGWSFVIFCILGSALVVITFIDLDFQIIPDRITLTGIPLGLVAGSLLIHDPFMRAAILGFRDSIIGLIAGGGLFYLVAVLSRGGMGGGDSR